ncbi:hypothetical protein GCM10027425_10050 [Alteromonas gracilis]
MKKSEEIVSLIAGYETYADLSEVNLDAASAAPEAFTTPVCVATIASSKVCASVVSGATAATVTNGC